MKKKISRTIKSILLSILVIFISTGCMKMGTKRSGPMMESMPFNSPRKVQKVNTGQAIDQMIEEAVLDLSKQNLDINSIAVWQIKSQTADLETETIGHKLITQLDNMNRFKVVTRERLSELLEEQGLSLSGTIDDKSAVEIGNLIGVEGFISGFASLENDRLILSFTLLETKSGVIIWAKTLESPINSQNSFFKGRM